jgi:hypothetical protein
MSVDTTPVATEITVRIFMHSDWARSPGGPLLIAQYNIAVKSRKEIGRYQRTAADGRCPLRDLAELVFVE